MKTVLLFETQSYVGAQFRPRPSIAVTTNRPWEVLAALRSVHRVGEDEVIRQSVLEAIKNIPETEMVKVDYC